jgi:hypothetical protein
MQRFAGLDRAYGRYVVGGQPDARGKITGQRRTVKAPVTLALWVAHLTTPEGLGIVPVRPDGTCVFAAIDIDVYPLEIKDIAARIDELRLPLVACRTKSGGTHAYLFADEPGVPAELARDKLELCAIALGYPGVEVFPKQSGIGDDDTGNWINMPYSQGDRTLRYAVGADGRALSPEEFLDFAAARTVTAQTLQALEPTRTVRRVNGAAPSTDWSADNDAAHADDVVRDDDDTDSGDPFFNGPPCLMVLGARGFPEGARNNGLFNIGIYLKKRFGDAAADMLPEYNRLFMDPPLSAQEVASIAKSIRKKDYGYKCKDQPIVSCCDKPVCKTRDFGIMAGADRTNVVIGGLIKIDTTPPTWRWEINGTAIDLDTDDLLSQKGFQKAVLEQLHVLTPPLKASKWKALLEEALSTLTVIDVPEDATREGQMLTHLHNFCTSRGRARVKDELLMGKPYVNGARTYFTSTSFITYLSTHRVSGVSERDLYRWLRDIGLETHRERLKGKEIAFWSVPSFSEQTEDHVVPRVAPKDQM